MVNELYGVFLTNLNRSIHFACMNVHFGHTFGVCLLYGVLNFLPIFIKICTCAYEYEAMREIVPPTHPHIHIQNWRESYVLPPPFYTFVAKIKEKAKFLVWKQPPKKTYCPVNQGYNSPPFFFSVDNFEHSGALLQLDHTTARSTLLAILSDHRHTNQ